MYKISGDSKKENVENDIGKWLECCMAKNVTSNQH